MSIFIPPQALLQLANTWTQQQTFTPGLLVGAGLSSVSEPASGVLQLKAGSGGNAVSAIVTDTSNQNDFRLGSTTPLGWSSTAQDPSAAVADTILRRDGAANVLAQRNSTNAQTFRVYETFTDASNYERASLSCASDTVTLAAETAGTGVDNMNVTLTPAGTGIVVLNGSAIATIASGSLPAAATQDITNIPAIYSYLILQVTGWSQATNTARLLVRVDTDNGASFDATAGNYVGINISGTTTTNWTTNAGASLTDGATQTTAQTGSATVYIYGYHAAPMALAMSRVIAATTETQCWGNFIGAGGAAINALRIATSAAGNFDAGTYALYGVR